MLEEPEFAFFSPSDTGQLLFRLWVHKSAYNSGHWRKVGNSELSPDLATEIPRFNQDPINGSLSIHQNGRERPATEVECQELERAAVWEASHVEERITDHMQGKENVWVKSLAIKPAT